MDLAYSKEHIGTFVVVSGDSDFSPLVSKLKELGKHVIGLGMQPSTSELLDWLKLLLAEDIAPEALRSQDKKVIIPPLHGALLKNEQDVHLFERVAFMARAR